MNARINGSFSHLIEQENSVQLELRNQLGSLAQIKVLVTPYRILDSFDVRTTEMLDYHEVE